MSETNGAEHSHIAPASDTPTVPVKEALKHVIAAVLATLTYREREVLRLRYGLVKGWVYTRDQIGHIFQISRHEAHVIEATAISKLRHPTRARQFAPFADLLLTEGPTDPMGNYYLVQEVVGYGYDRHTPNLFEYARSERWQDAFLCWLLSWGSRKKWWIDKALNETASVLIGKLLSLHNLTAPASYDDVRIEVQFKGLDILVVVNEEFAILIEDKTETKEHSDQLFRYMEAVKTEYPGLEYVPIYLKTGEQSCYRAVDEAGWKCFTRGDLLHVLALGRKAGVTSDIFRDFHLKLLNRDLRAWRQRCRKP